jgi:hypothetical protein
LLRSPSTAARARAVLQRSDNPLFLLFLYFFFTQPSAAALRPPPCDGFELLPPVASAGRLRLRLLALPLFTLCDSLFLDHCGVRQGL